MASTRCFASGNPREPHSRNGATPELHIRGRPPKSVTGIAWRFKKWMAADDPRRIRLHRELANALAADFPPAVEHLIRIGVITNEFLSIGESAAVVPD
jgi:hypothetical protein